MTLLLTLGLPRLSFDTALTTLLTTSDPYLEEFNSLDEQFPNQLTASFAFLADEGETVFTRPMLEAITTLKESYTQIPFAQRVSTLVDFYSPETQTRLFTRSIDRYSDEELAELAVSASQDRLLTSNILSKDTSLTFATVVFDAADASDDQRLDIATAILSLKDELRSKHPDITILANSDVLLEQSSQQAMIDDLTTLLPIVILICVLTICYCFKSAILGVCILTHVLFTLVCTVGALGLLGYAFNSI